MKKWMAMMAAGVMAVSFAGCGAGDVGSAEYMASKAAASQAAAASSQAAQSQAEVQYENSLKGLQQYMTAKGAVAGDPTTMEASLIGAKEGVRYRGSYEGKENVTLELYQYDSSNLNDAAKQVLADVKDKGTFTIMEKQVPATLNGDYLMVYTDTQTGDVHTQRAEEVKTIFQNFQK
ncbi:hypothetical protein [Faecalispora anaeroviscerum]|uniref:hypothetical protein n=1 Tax=Faecalispora anaeroviscerum TaxID=2991836 RepID=UPI0024B956E6|nr:hypothetical protein [Faecalispora anaeroviscerum]